MWKCPACQIAVDDAVDVCPKCKYKRTAPADAPATPKPQPANKSAVPAATATWHYSGKAFRGRCVLNCLITLLFLGLGIWLQTTQKMGAHAGWIWGALLVIPVIIWVWFGIVYWYRTSCIQYRLTESNLYLEQGFLRKTVDTMELIGISDLKMEQSLWDRLINGGVGKVLVYSKLDKTDAILPMRGLENPKEVLETIDQARRRLRGSGMVQM